MGYVPPPPPLMPYRLIHDISKPIPPPPKVFYGNRDVTYKYHPNHLREYNLQNKITMPTRSRFKVWFGRMFGDYEAEARCYYRPSIDSVVDIESVVEDMCDL